MEVREGGKVGRKKGDIASDKAEEGQRQGDGKDRIDETETEGRAKD